VLLPAFDLSRNAGLGQRCCQLTLDLLYISLGR
jgi:hypothetical protein